MVNIIVSDGFPLSGGKIWLLTVHCLWSMLNEWFGFFGRPVWVKPQVVDILVIVLALIISRPMKFCTEELDERETSVRKRKRKHHNAHMHINSMRLKPSSKRNVVFAKEKYVCRTHVFILFFFCCCFDSFFLRSSLTFFHVTVPSVHLAYIHKHSIFIGVAICCTNRKIIVWTLTLTVDVLCHTNCLIGFCRCCQWCCWRSGAQNSCNHFRANEEREREWVR